MNVGGIKHYPLNFISYFLAVPFILHGHDFDLVVEDNIPPVSFGLSPWYTRKPVISQVQSLFAAESSKKHSLPFWIVEKYSAKMYQNSSYSPKTSKDQIRNFNKKSHKLPVIPNGFIKNLSAHAENNKQLLFLGRIDYYHKGLAHLIKIAKTYKVRFRITKSSSQEMGGTVKTEEDINPWTQNINYIGKSKAKKRRNYEKQHGIASSFAFWNTSFYHTWSCGTENRQFFLIFQI